MKIFALLEHWFIADGNYEHFNAGETRDLVLMINSPEVQPLNDTSELITNTPDAHFKIQGKVIYLGEEVTVVEAQGLKVFLENSKFKQDLQTGQEVAIAGIIGLDYYIWQEKYQYLKDIPDIYYKCRVEQIMRYIIPEKYFSRDAGGGIWIPTHSDEFSESMKINSTAEKTGKPGYDILELNLNF